MANVSKQHYLEICEAMGKEPEYSKMPLELEDLSIQSQTCIMIFGMLPDKIGEMSGVYIGKDFTALTSLFELFEVDKRDWLLYTQIINYCIHLYKENIQAKQKQHAELNKAKNAKEGVNVNG